MTDCDGLITSVRNANNAAANDLLRAEVERLRALVKAVEKLHRAKRDDVSDRLGLEPYAGDICAECYSDWPCATAAALSSPTPEAAA